MSTAILSIGNYFLAHESPACDVPDFVSGDSPPSHGALSIILRGPISHMGRVPVSPTSRGYESYRKPFIRALGSRTPSHLRGKPAPISIHNTPLPSFLLHTSWQYPWSPEGEPLSQPQGPSSLLSILRIHRSYGLLNEMVPTDPAKQPLLESPSLGSSVASSTENQSLVRRATEFVWPYIKLARIDGLLGVWLTFWPCGESALERPLSLLRAATDSPC